MSYLDWPRAWVPTSPFSLVDLLLSESGKGEVLTAMEMPPALKDQWLSVIVPLVHVSTADAYAGIVPNERSRPDLMSLVAAGIIK